MPKKIIEGATDGESGWSVGKHDTIPKLESSSLNPLETHVYLAAFLQVRGPAIRGAVCSGPDTNRKGH